MVSWKIFFSLDLGSNALIFTGTYGGIIKGNNQGGGEVISNMTDYVLGVAIDTMRQKLHWTSWNGIYRSEMGGTAMVETLLETEECKLKSFSVLFVYKDSESRVG